MPNDRNASDAAREPADDICFKRVGVDQVRFNPARESGHAEHVAHGQPHSFQLAEGTESEGVFGSFRHGRVQWKNVCLRSGSESLRKCAILKQQHNGLYFKRVQVADKIEQRHFAATDLSRVVDVQHTYRFSQPVYSCSNLQVHLDSKDRISPFPGF